MLLHHFGSREELLLAVVDDVERKQMALLHELAADGRQERRGTVTGGGMSGFAAMWAHLRKPELRGLERLFFECYARGAQGESPFTTMLPAAVDRWLAMAQTDAQADPAMARLGLAVTRGLLLDLAGTDDDAGVEAAAQHFIALIGAHENSSD